MAYVDLTRDPGAMRRIFLALGLAGQDEDVRATALTGGVSSGIHRVDLRSGSFCVKQALPQLKVAKVWMVPVERVFAEIRYLQVVGRIAPGQVPRVLGTDEASKSFVMPFLGPEYRNWKADLLAGRVDVRVARAVGDLLGRIHAATAGDAQLAAQFATDENFHALRLEPYLVETARVHPALADGLLATVERTAATRRVLVHGDVSPKNILVGPRGPVFVDAECAWYGDPAFDLAFCLNHLLLKCVWRPRWWAVYLQSFTTLFETYLAGVQWEPAAELEARAAHLLPGLFLARIDGKSPVEYITDDRDRDKVRRVARPLLLHPVDRLATIRDAWRAEIAKW